MRTTWKLLRNESKQNDSVELSRFFVFGGGKVKREKMRKVFFLVVICGLVVMCVEVRVDNKQKI